MDVISIAEALDKFGFPTVIAALVIVGIIWLVKHESKRDEEATKERAAEAEQRQALIDMIVAKEKQQYPVHTEAQEKESRKFDQFLSKQLQELRENTHANRALFVAYHNGGAMLNARPFAKFSITAEKTDVKTPAVMQSYQAVPCGLITTLREIMATDGYYFCGDVNTLEEHNYRDILNSWGAQSVYCAAVQDNINDIVVGFVFIQFDDTMEENRVIKHEIIHIANAIAGAVQVNSDNK